MKYALQPAARADLTNIWLYTAERWGVQQADLYTASINQKIIDTSAYPQAGSPLGDVKMIIGS